MTHYEQNNIDPHKQEQRYIYNHKTKKWIKNRLPCLNNLLKKK